MNVGKTFPRGVDTALIAHPGLAVILILVPQVLLAYGAAGPVGHKPLNGLAAGMYADAPFAYILWQVTTQTGINGVNKFLTEKLVTEILVQVYVQTLALTAYVGALHLESLEVKIALVQFKVIPYSGANSGIVRLSLKG
jgi:hypothetical protein